ncbi:hypothetical protein HDU77_008094 [Chytriomyces hyalinus]|nr:hypothetical protein HDU77_008094 [Chytriomyces hyalinus]
MGAASAQTKSGDGTEVDGLDPRAGGGSGAVTPPTPRTPLNSLRLSTGRGLALTLSPASPDLAPEAFDAKGVNATTHVSASPYLPSGADSGVADPSLGHGANYSMLLRHQVAATLHKTLQLEHMLTQKELESYEKQCATAHLECHRALSALHASQVVMRERRRDLDVAIMERGAVTAIVKHLKLRLESLRKRMWDGEDAKRRGSVGAYGSASLSMKNEFFESEEALLDMLAVASSPANNEHLSPMQSSHSAASFLALRRHSSPGYATYHSFHSGAEASSDTSVGVNAKAAVVSNTGVEELDAAASGDVADLDNHRGFADTIAAADSSSLPIDESTAYLGLSDDSILPQMRMTIPLNDKDEYDPTDDQGYDNEIPDIDATNGYNQSPQYTYTKTPASIHYSNGKTYDDHYDYSLTPSRSGPTTPTLHSTPSGSFTFPAITTTRLHSSGPLLGNGKLPDTAAFRRASLQSAALTLSPNPGSDQSLNSTSATSANGLGTSGLSSVACVGFQRGQCLGTGPEGCNAQHSCVRCGGGHPVILCKKDRNNATLVVTESTVVCAALPSITLFAFVRFDHSAEVNSVSNLDNYLAEYIAKRRSEGLVDDDLLRLEIQLTHSLPMSGASPTVPMSSTSGNMSTSSNSSNALLLPPLPPPSFMTGGNNNGGPLTPHSINSSGLYFTHRNGGMVGGSGGGDHSGGNGLGMSGNHHPMHLAAAAAAMRVVGGSTPVNMSSMAPREANAPTNTASARDGGYMMTNGGSGSYYGGVSFDDKRKKSISASSIGSGVYESGSFIMEKERAEICRDYNNS